MFDAVPPPTGFYAPLQGENPDDANFIDWFKRSVYPRLPPQKHEPLTCTPIKLDAQSIKVSAELKNMLEEQRKRIAARTQTEEDERTKRRHEEEEEEDETAAVTPPWGPARYKGKRRARPQSRGDPPGQVGGDSVHNTNLVPYSDCSPQVRLDNLLNDMGKNCEFDLTPLKATTGVANAGIRLSVLADEISMRLGGVDTFKIGVTWNPPHRWENTTYGYAHEGYTRCVILLWDWNPKTVGMYEAFSIDKFRAHPSIANRKKGDDNVQQMSPHFLYLALRKS